MPAVRTTTEDEIRELQHALRGAAEHAHVVDTRPYELEARARVNQELVPRIHAALDEAVGVLARLLDRYEPPAQAGLPEDSGFFDVHFEEMVEPANQQPDPWKRVADVSFMARWELARKRRALATAALAEDGPSLLSECCSVRRRVVKATSGVEQVLAEVEGRPSVFEGLYRTEQQRAIETRAAYLSFVSSLQGLDDERIPITRSVRLAGIGIARLIGRDIYQDLWVDDRLQVRELQRRLLAWLRGNGDALDGARLLGDIHAFAELLMQVNRRPVLIQYDREVLRRLRAALREPTIDADAHFPVLSSIRGRDRELDALIDAQAQLSPHLWSATVERVLDELTPHDEH